MELFGSLDGEHSQYSYVAFLKDIEEWKTTVLKDARDSAENGSCGLKPWTNSLDENGSCELKPWTNPLDDKIQCALRWMEEPDRLKALLTTTKLNFGPSLEPAFQAARSEAGGRTYEVKWMTRPMALFEVLIELQKPESRDNVLLVLSSYLIQTMEDDFDQYKLIGSSLYHFSGMVGILLQEITKAYSEFSSTELSMRTSRRIVNVLNVLQCIAANKEISGAFLEALPPNYLVPFIFSDNTDDRYETVRLMSLSVMGIICKGLEGHSVIWALENDVILACRHAIQTGSHVSKLISLHILEAILKSEIGLSAFCNPAFSHLEKVTETLKNLVTLEAADQSSSKKGLLFPVMRCYMHLVKDQRLTT